MKCSLHFNALRTNESNDNEDSDVQWMFLELKLIKLFQFIESGLKQRRWNIFAVPNFTVLIIFVITAVHDPSVHPPPPPHMFIVVFSKAQVGNSLGWKARSLSWSMNVNVNIQVLTEGRVCGEYKKADNTDRGV